MDGLIILIILVPLVFLILLISIYSRTGEQQRLLESLYDKIKQLNNELSSLRRELKTGKDTKETEKVEITPSKSAITEKVMPAEVTEIEPASPPKERVKKEVTIETATPATKTEKSLPSPALSDKNSWLPENADWEKFIGENLANKAGIAVLVLGIAFFIKYAIDKNWINEAGRVIIGLISGGILVGLAHYFRNSYRSFSSVLVGGGLSVFYFSIAFAFHQYHLIGQTAAFIFMVIISGLGVALSLHYNRQELAVLATIGGFITPFLVSTGDENYIALFTYLSVLNTGLMVLAWFKRWPSINMIALFFTLIIYGGWLFKRTVFEDEPLPHIEAFFFASLFYFQFLLMNIINSLRLKRKFGSFDFIILFSINFLFYAAGTIILDSRGDGNFKGLFTVLLGLLNLLLAASFHRKKSVDRNFVSLLTGLAISFISLTAPVQLKGNHISLFWAAEMVVLFWLYHRIRAVLLGRASFFIAILMLLSLTLTWGDVYLSGKTVIPVIINKGFITTLTASVALFILCYLMRKEKQDENVVTAVGIPTRKASLIAAIFVTYLAGTLEVYYQFSTRYPQAPLYLLYLELFSFASAILLLHIFRKDQTIFALQLSFTAACYLFYLFNFSSTLSVSKFYLKTDNNNLFFSHWIAVILLGWLLFRLIHSFFRQTEKKWVACRPAFTWIIAAGFILMLSLEMYHIIFRAAYGTGELWRWWENLYYKACLTLLWGFSSFILMWLGMKKNYRPLRILSLTLFTVTLVKLFLYDIRNIPPGGKIAAFILLGILLLAVSFMYQRLKRIIIDNTTK